MDSVIDHSWGKEIIFAKTSEYDGKINLFEQPDSTMPFTIYKDRDSTWFINAGKFVLTLIDPSTGKMQTKELNEGDVFRCTPMVPYQIKSLVANSSYTEVGNGKDSKSLLSET